MWLLPALGSLADGSTSPSVLPVFRACVKPFFTFSQSEFPHSQPLLLVLMTFKCDFLSCGQSPQSGHSLCQHEPLTGFVRWLQAACECLPVRAVAPPPTLALTVKKLPVSFFLAAAASWESPSCLILRASVFRQADSSSYGEVLIRLQLSTLHPL